MSLLYLAVNFIFYLISLRTNTEDPNLIVNTTTGLVRGKLNRYEDFYYYSYEGIPYAESPIGDLRFMPPVPKKPWKNIYNATKPGAICPQEAEPYKRNEMNEDCLFINIYAPVNNKRESLPILVFVHGGSFRKLSGNIDKLYGPQLIIQHNIIVVTLNYRLGVAGFLSLDIPEASGNAGLKDVILGLQWVTQSLQSFNGNVNNITLGGHSSGSSMVHYIMMSEKASGLFHQVILFSGSAIGQKVLSRHCKDNSLLLSRTLGLAHNNSDVLLQQLKHINIFDLVDAYTNLWHLNVNIYALPVLFIPCIEINTPHALFTKDPVEIIKMGLPQNVPVLAGITAMESLFLLNFYLDRKEQYFEMLQNAEYFIPSNIEYPPGSEEAKSLGNSIKQFYFGHKNPIDVMDLMTYLSDLYFVYGVDSWINLHKNLKRSNILYYYVFNYEGTLNWAKIVYKVNRPGVSHTDDMGYIFKTAATETKLKGLNIKCRKMMRTMLSLYSNFIKFGNPTPKGTISDFRWPEYDERKNILMITENPSVTSRSNISCLTRIHFWDKVYEDYYSYVANGGVLVKKIIP